MRYRLFLLIALLFTSCYSDKPENLISEEDMVSILKEINLIEARRHKRIEDYGNEVNEATLKNYTALFKKYNLTDSAFLESYTYYQEHPAQLEEIYNTVMIELEEELSLLREANNAEPKTIGQDSVGKAIMKGK